MQKVCTPSDKAKTSFVFLKHDRAHKINLKLKQLSPIEHIKEDILNMTVSSFNREKIEV